jgi:hypothetical protein
VLFTAFFLSLFILGWMIVGAIPWLVLSVKTHGSAGLWYLPLSMFTGVVGGVAVPVLWLDTSTGIWVSFIAAFLLPSLLLAARRFSLRPVVEHSHPQKAPEQQPE